MNIDPSTAAPDELLASLAVRDVLAADPRVVARFAADSDLAERWREIADTITDLERVGTAAAVDLAPASSVPRLDTMAAIRSFRGEPAPRSAAPRRTPSKPLHAAVITVAAIVALWLRFGTGSDPFDPRLGGSNFTLAPRDAPWIEGTPLHWQRIRGADRYRLEFRVPATSSAPAVPIETPDHAADRLADTAWNPLPAVRAALPPRFEWRVIAYDSSNDPIATSPWAQTWR